MCITNEIIVPALEELETLIENTNNLKSENTPVKNTENIENSATEPNPVEQIIENALKELGKLCLSVNGKELSSTKLIFPNKEPQKEKSLKKLSSQKLSENKNDYTRFSEQELKQILIEKIEEYNQDNKKIFYTVETPSNWKYSVRPKLTLNGNSTVRIDLSLYNQEKNLLSHIELKEGNPDSNQISKDFLRLICEQFNLEGKQIQKSIISNYFIHYDVVGSDSTSETFKNTLYSILSKYEAAYADTIEAIDEYNNKIENKEKKIDVEKVLSKVVIYFLIVNNYKNTSKINPQKISLNIFNTNKKEQKIKMYFPSLVGENNVQ